jgi:glycosyltransferase involved in cell wall biosynthesis
MKISIVVPTYNQGPFIFDCLKSIQNQTYQDFEVIIQDNCSTDQTQALCLRFREEDPRFQYYREKDLGQSHAINQGLLKSTGTFWTWLCSDDFFVSDSALEGLVKALMKSDDSVCGAFGLSRFVDSKGQYVRPAFTLRRDVVQDDFKLCFPFSQPASLLKTDCLRVVGGVDENLSLGMDLDLFIKLTANRKFKFVNHEVAANRIQSNSKSEKLSLETARTALKIVHSHFRDVGSPGTSMFLQSFAFHYIEKMKSFLKFKDFIPSGPQSDLNDAPKSQANTMTLKSKLRKKAEAFVATLKWLEFKY